MKHFLTVTALTSLVASGALAATEAEQATIRDYLPDVNVETLGDRDVAVLIGIAHGGDTASEKRAKMRALVGDSNTVDVENRQQQIERLQGYAPDIAFEEFTDAELAQAVTIVNSGTSETDSRAQLESFALERDGMTADPLTDGEIAAIRDYAPDIDLTALSDNDLLRIQTAIAGGDRDQIMAVIDGVTSS
jgi:hypothetical protein